MKDEPKIEKGIPTPVKRGNSRGYAAAMEKMKVSESLVLPVKSYSAAWGHAAKSLGKGNFIVRRTDGGFRVWKTA